MITSVKIKTAVRDGRTYLGEMFYSPPVKLADITEDRRSGTLHLMQMSSSPGILDGDEYDMVIDLAANSSLKWSTQAYQHVFQMENKAVQNLNVTLGENARFFYVPQPVVPHAAADFRCRNRIGLSDGNVLVWSEILASGRKLNDENFLYKSYHSMTEIFVGKKLFLKENQFLEPALRPLGGIGQLEGFSHQCSLICIGDFDRTIKLKVLSTLDLEEKILYGITDTAVNGFIVRILGNGGEQLYRCAQNISSIIQKNIK